MKAGITRPDTLTRCALSPSAPPDATLARHAARRGGAAACYGADSRQLTGDRAPKYAAGAPTTRWSSANAEARAWAIAKAVRGAISRSRLDLDQRHLRHRAARRRAAFRAGGLAAGGAALWLGLRDLLGLRRHRAVEIFEAELLDARFVLDRDDAHVAAALELAEQDFVGERLLDVLLDEARHRPRPHLLVIAVLDQPLAGLFRQLDGDVTVAELCLQLKHEFFDHLGDDLGREMRKGDDRIEPVDRFDVVALALDAGKPIGLPREIGRAGIGGHDQDHVAEVDLLAVVIGELAVIHDLQQHVEQVRMRLLDLVEQENAMRMLV